MSKNSAVLLNEEDNLHDVEQEKNYSINDASDEAIEKIIEKCIKSDETLQEEIDYFKQC